MKGCLLVLLLLVALAGAGGAWLYYSDADIPLLGDDTADDATPGGPVPATVAIAPDDSIQSCFERNLTPALLLNLYRGDTTLSNDIIRACLEQDLPPELVGLIDPIIEETSRCASSVAQTLTTEEVLILGQEGDSPEKQRVIRRVAEDIVRCVARRYDIPTEF